MAEQKTKSCSVRKKVFRIILAVFLIFAVKITVTILSKPKVTTDYVAKLNQLTKPENYNPEDNAAPYYQKAFDLFVEMPDIFQETGMSSLMPLYNIRRPSDLDPNTVNLVERWLSENQPAFEQIRLATEKPYCWIERKLDEDKNYTGHLIYAELGGVRHLTAAMLWDAVIKAYNGDDDQSLENILTCYKVGIQINRTPSLLTEQITALNMKDKTIDAAMAILAYKKIDDGLLRGFQKKLELLSEKTDLDLQADTLQMKEIVKMTFARNPLGTDRLAFSCYKGFQCMGGLPRGRWKNCFWGPSRKEMAEHLDKLLLLHEPLKDKTPWGFKNIYAKQIQKIDELTYNNFFTQTLYPCYISYLERIQKTQTRFKALLTTMSLQLYKSENGSYPEKLNELVKTGLLDSVPIDPYSNEEIGYILSNGDFKLYSVGTDFEDNKAEIFEKKPEPGSMAIPWLMMGANGPMADPNMLTRSNVPYPSRIDPRHYGPRLKCKDIIYWPVNRPRQIHTEGKHNWKKRDPPHNVLM